jgi:tRNA A-37 threonylcarbamoyl transferase component Bud32
MSNPTPDHAGVLQKEGGKVFKSNQTRYFELYGCSLVWYKARPTPGEKPLGCLDLKNTKCMDAKEKLAWSITGPSMKKTYVLHALNEAEKKVWMTKLDAATTKTSTLGTTVAANESDDEGGATGAAGTTEAMVFNKHDPKKKVGVNDFEPLAVVGKGAFGKVMQVRKKDTGEIYAMKALNKDVIEKENLIEHTMAEKSILQKIQHPFIVGLHYAFQTSDKLYLILDFLSGGELFFHLQHEGKFDESRARFYISEIGLALGHVHSQNIIYRDLKPENTVLDRYGHICLTDFGLAKTNIQDSTAQTFCGTPEYLAPEFLMGGGHGKAVDWWSLGILLYEMLSGLPPFYSDNVNEMYELILQKPLEFTDEFSPEARDLITQLLDRDPTKRLQDVEKFKAHPFFKGVDWVACFNRQITPPFVPDPSALNNFDKEFTQERARYSMARKAADGGNAEYTGFTFTGTASQLEAAQQEKK